MQDSHTLDALKGRLPDLLTELGAQPKLKGDNNLTSRCPFHDDKAPSLSATLKGGSWVWFCHPCDIGGTIVDLYAKLHALGVAEAIRELKEKYLGGGHGPVRATPAPPPRVHKPARPADPWPILRSGTDQEWKTLATLRAIPSNAVCHAQRLGYLRFTEFRRASCYALTDGAGAFLQLRKLSGEPFLGYDGTFKSYNWPGCRCVPLGTRHLHTPQPVLMAEGAVSILELLSLFAISESHCWDWSVLAMTGASAGIPTATLEKLRGRLVRIVGDKDEAGQRAVTRWAAELQAHGCTVQRVNLSAIPDLDGLPKGDLGDLLRLPNSIEKQKTINSLITL